MAMKSLENCSTDRSSSDVRKWLMAQIAAEDAMTPEERRNAMLERMRRSVERYNATPGNLKDGYTVSDARGENQTVEGDGYDCPLCLNRGTVMGFRTDDSGVSEFLTLCRCMEIRKSIWRLKRSGLEKSIREYKFRNFKAEEPWQKAMLDTVTSYLTSGAKDGKWLYMGGQPGCGKTHLCTAVAGKLLYQMPLLYVVWPQISKRLKAIVNEAEEYASEVGRLQTVDALYIDDLFKPVTEEDRDGTVRKGYPTAADIKLAFEIINYRYVNHLPTILSSEWHIADLADIDEATGSRIAERSKGYCLDIRNDRARNRRLIGITEV